MDMNREECKKISFTIPCYRSEKTVSSVISEIKSVMQVSEFDYEIIAVNDASTDDVYSVLVKLAEEDERIKVVDLAINTGKHGALMAAFAYVTGDYVVSVDDDGQCPLEHLWDLMEPLGKGYDMAIAKYPNKKQSVLKNFGSRVNSMMSRSLLDRPKNMVFSNFIIRKKFVVDEMKKYTNPFPYLEGLTLRTTKNIAMVEMEQRSRISGKSGYTFKKSLKLWLNGYTAFSVKPLRLASLLGFFASMGGLLFSIFLIVRKMIMGNAIQIGYTSVISVVLIIGGIIMLLLGMLGEYIGRMYICINNSPQYVVRETLNINHEMISGK